MEFKKFHHERYSEQNFWNQIKITIESTFKTGLYKSGYLLDSMFALGIRIFCREQSTNSKLYPPIFNENMDTKIFENMANSTGDIFSQQGVFLVSLAVTNFLLKKGKTYSVAEDFFTKFKEVSLNDLCYGKLPKEFFGFVQFPYPICVKKDKDINGLYFSIVRQICSETLKEVNLLVIVPVRSDGCLTSSICHDIDSNRSFEESLSNCEQQDFVRFCFNLLLYIHSGDPDIREYRNQIKYQSNTSKTPVRAHKDLSQETIYLVGYNWKKPIIVNYDASNWEREGHFRWQHYGQNNSLIKLIWISPTVCMRKSNLLCQNPQDQS